VHLLKKQRLFVDSSQFETLDYVFENVGVEGGQDHKAWFDQVKVVILYLLIFEKQE